MNTTTSIQYGIIPANDKAINVDICVVLSANGSINFPKLVIKLNFLAINPSSTSVAPDIVKNTNAAT